MGEAAVGWQAVFLADHDLHLERVLSFDVVQPQLNARWAEKAFKKGEQRFLIVGVRAGENVVVQTTWITGRDGVNSARLFFEHHGCTFQEVGQQHDFGKDAYVDLADHAGITPLCVALQIKSGSSYHVAKGDYVVPVEHHADLWRRSTVPVFGIVHDPDDKQLRWVDLTGYLRAHPEQAGGNVPVLGNRTLDKLSLQGAFTNAVRAYGARGTTDLVLNLLSSDPFQTAAVYDAWALSRSEPKYLLILRRFIMDFRPECVRKTIWFLSHLGLHPNILWTKDNWIRPDAEQQLRPTLRWSPEEIAHMIRAVPHEDFGKGTLGECLDVLLYEDPAIVRKLHLAIPLLLKDPEATCAVRAATLAISHSKSQRRELAWLVKNHPALMDHEWFQSVAAAVHDCGNLSLY